MDIEECLAGAASSVPSCDISADGIIKRGRAKSIRRGIFVGTGAVLAVAAVAIGVTVPLSMVPGSDRASYGFSETRGLSADEPEPVSSLASWVAAAEATTDGETISSQVYFAHRETLFVDGEYEGPEILFSFDGYDPSQEVTISLYVSFSTSDPDAEGYDSSAFSEGTLVASVSTTLGEALDKGYGCTYVKEDVTCGAIYTYTGFSAEPFEAAVSKDDLIMDKGEVRYECRVAPKDDDYLAISYLSTDGEASDASNPAYWNAYVHIDYEIHRGGIRLM